MPRELKQTDPITSGGSSARSAGLLMWAGVPAHGASRTQCRQQRLSELLTRTGLFSYLICYSNEGFITYVSSINNQLAPYARSPAGMAHVRGSASCRAGLCWAAVQELRPPGLGFGSSTSAEVLASWSLCNSVFCPD